MPGILQIVRIIRSASEEDAKGQPDWTHKSNGNDVSPKAEESEV